MDVPLDQEVMNLPRMMPLELVIAVPNEVTGILATTLTRMYPVVRIGGRNLGRHTDKQGLVSYDLQFRSGRLLNGPQPKDPNRQQGNESLIKRE
jgi:hypothetical protein